jgi:MFS family permease
VNPATRIDTSGAPLYTPTFWTACAIHFTGAMSHGMFLLFPLFVRHLGGDALTIGLVLGTGLALSVVLRPAVGTLLDRHGRRRVLLWSSLANAACFPFFILLDSTGPWLFILSAFHLDAARASPYSASRAWRRTASAPRSPSSSSRASAGRGSSARRARSRCCRRC